MFLLEIVFLSGLLLGSAVRAAASAWIKTYIKKHANHPIGCFLRLYSNEVAYFMAR